MDVMFFVRLRKNKDGFVTHDLSKKRHVTTDIRILYEGRKYGMSYNGFYGQ